MKTLTERFDDYNAANPHVYDMFVKYTKTAIEAGQKRYSAWAIVNRMRWESDIVTKGDKFKISNDYIALFARKFVADYPMHKDFFSMKPMVQA